MSNFLQECNENWLKIHNEIFPNGIPVSAEWANLDDIIKILNVIGKAPGMNHVFFPRSGGLDLHGAKRSYEENHLELNFKGTYVVLAEKLLFHGIDSEQNENLEWNYFELITTKMEKSGVRGQGDVDEEVTELEPGIYVERSAWEEKEYNEEPLPPHARLVNREISGGNYVIFNKASKYNQIVNNYAGEHNQMGTEEFKKYIRSAIR